MAATASTTTRYARLRAGKNGRSPFKSPDLLRLFYCWGSLARKILFIFSADGLLPFQAGSEVGYQPRRGGGMTPLSTPAAAR